jgi:LDH2 family malate/lactate/ureidoglycolate dehydrogenase
MAEGRFKVPDEIAIRVPADAMRATVEDLFVAHGMPPAHAVAAADVLIWADLRGIDSHGVSNMMTFYLVGLRDGSINPNPAWHVTRDFAAVANVDSDRGLGLVVGPWAMNLAIQKARQFGIGCVVAGNGRHFGAAGYHAYMAAAQGMVGMAMTVGGLAVVPTFGSKPMVGLNPLAIAAPAATEAPFIFDASMSSVAGNKIRLARRLGVDIAGGWIAEPDGTPIMEEGPVPESFHMLPVGATREIGSHKGYSLAVMVDILSGLLAGSGPGFNAGGTISHHFLVFNVEAFTDQPAFLREMDVYLRGLRETPPAPGQPHVEYAGQRMGEVLVERTQHGIPYHPEVVERFRAWAQEYNTPDRLSDTALISSS